jgi:Arc/MetJ-type ribon-helix-helix transcriptional regulator
LSEVDDFMTITLTPEQEQIVDDQLRSGTYRTPEEVVAGALRALRKVARAPTAPAASSKKPYVKRSGS